jgi:hypothetical protein
MKYEYLVEPFDSYYLDDLTTKINDYLKSITEVKDNEIILADVKIHYSSAYDQATQKIIYTALVMMTYDLSNFYVLQSMKSR